MPWSNVLHIRSHYVLIPWIIDYLRWHGVLFLCLVARVTELGGNHVLYDSLTETPALVSFSKVTFEPPCAPKQPLPTQASCQGGATPGLPASRPRPRPLHMGPHTVRSVRYVSETCINVPKIAPEKVLRNQHPGEFSAKHYFCSQCI